MCSAIATTFAFAILSREKAALIFRMCAVLIWSAEFTRRLRAQPNLSEVPVIVITVYEEREFRLQALKAGATEEDFAEVTLISAALRAGAAVTHGTHLMGG